MALFLHHAGSDGELVTSFHIRQGDRAAGLEWTLRDGSEREILVFQSTDGVVGDGVDPTIDHRQRVVYQGSGLAARVDDDLSDDVAYSYRDDIAITTPCLPGATTATGICSSPRRWHREA